MKPLDHILEKFLETIGISTYDALIEFNLAPLSTRRSLSALAVIHRAVLLKGPKHLHQFFQLDPHRPRYSTRLGHALHERQLQDPFNALHRDYINRSVLGYIWIYNLLPADIVDCSTVKAFQRGLQLMMKNSANRDDESWHFMFSSQQSRNDCILRQL